jgi:hypothetical protein
MASVLIASDFAPVFFFKIAIEFQINLQVEILLF